MRKIIIIIAALLSGCANQPPQSCNTKYLIHIWNAHPSRAYTDFYNISNDSLSIEFIGGVVGDTNKIVFSKALTEDDRLNICNYLSSFDIDTLKQEYINHFAEDGDQKRIELKFGNKTKIIDVANFYQKDLDGLFEIINNVTREKRYKIWYEKPVSFK
ncbi:hypothetical protein [Chitinophaga tropicalis]|uniref:Lipoprotein n=1 Tax=Chitinophaga tropicalis TaxID=2683588 RepID=A0A7K1UDU7_9BACT|nr:hypothetical protein [Chitinophaga tropicalis]MVT12486.1 hypothetical protein [Chitinophaga tropicalis]